MTTTPVDQREYVRQRTSNATNASFPSKVPTATEPTGAGVTNLATAGLANASVRLLPFGIGADDTTFSVRVIGWNFIGTPGGTILWIPTILAEYACTLSAAVGVADKPVIETERFADTVTIVANMGTAGTDSTAISPQNDTPGAIIVNLRGVQKMELTYDMTGATSGNCLYQLL